MRSYVARMNVELVRWPGDPHVSPTSGIVVFPGCSWWPDDAEPPVPTDCLEDWAEAAAPETYLDARRRALQARARAHGARPDLDDDGLLRHRDAWVSLSPVEQSLARALLDSLRRSRAARRAGEPRVARRRTDSQRARRALCATPAPARRRSVSRSGPVRSRGYLLQEPSQLNGRTATTVTPSSRFGP
jgi:hypothetical protein